CYFSLQIYLLVDIIHSMKKINTVSKILDSAERLCATQGYNAFSYKDIAREIDIKTSSIHYHFPSKSDLGQAMMERHRLKLKHYLDTLTLEQKLSPKEKFLLMLSTIVKSTYQNEKRMCLAAMLAIDCLILDESIQTEVKLFFHFLESWMETTLTQAGIEQPKKEASILLAFIEGTLLLSRLSAGEERIQCLHEKVEALFH